MKKISLTHTQGKFATVDDIDYEFLMEWNWYFDGDYAVRHSHKSEGSIKRRTILMHRVVLSQKLGHSDFEETDHKNQNKIDNQRSNLRPASSMQNKRNTKVRQGSSKFKGVNWHKSHKKWQVQIRFEGKLKHLGHFTDEIKAAKAYNKAASEYFGEFARLNPV